VPRRLLLLLALGGCDRVFGLDREMPPPVCGPFGPPEEVAFDPALVDVHDLSVEPDGMRGFVYANLGNLSATPPTGAWRGPHAVKKDGNGMWIQDTVRDRPVLDSFDGGHVTRTGGLIGWIDMPRGVMVNLLLFSGTAWGQQTEVIEKETDRDVHIGNVIDLAVGPNLQQRFAVEIRQPIGTITTGEIRIIQRIPTDSTWMLTPQTDPLNATTPALDATGGVMTADHEILLYTARVGSQKMSRAFATRRDRDRYNPGVELIIDGVESDSGITEPWINADCTQLYFRTNDTTWVTTAVAP
jgi:hypothetical protein